MTKKCVSSWDNRQVHVIFASDCTLKFWQIQRQQEEGRTVSEDNGKFLLDKHREIG